MQVYIRLCACGCVPRYARVWTPLCLCSTVGASLGRGVCECESARAVTHVGLRPGL